MTEPQNPLPDENAAGRGEDKSLMFSVPRTTETVELEKETIRSLHKLAYILEGMRLREFVAHMQNPRRMLLTNFAAGVARGFGFIVGMTVVVGLALFLLREMVDLPLIGKYIARIVEIVRQELNNRPPGAY
jgi:hypothetical protein